MENSRIAAVFDEMADLLELQGDNPFRIRSYRNAAQSVRNVSERLETMVAQDVDLSSIPNIGESIAAKIHEILERGTCKRLEELRKTVPSGVLEIKWKRTCIWCLLKPHRYVSRNIYHGVGSCNL